MAQRAGGQAFRPVTCRGISYHRWHNASACHARGSRTAGGTGPSGLSRVAGSRTTDGTVPQPVTRTDLVPLVAQAFRPVTRTDLVPLVAQAFKPVTRRGSRETSEALRPQ